MESLHVRFHPAPAALAKLVSKPKSYRYSATEGVRVEARPDGGATVIATDGYVLGAAVVPADPGDHAAYQPAAALAAAPNSGVE